VKIPVKAMILSIRCGDSLKNRLHWGDNGFGVVVIYQREFFEERQKISDAQEINETHYKE
jgi:hypothetical protein